MKRRRRKSPVVRNRPDVVGYFDGACEPINPGGTAAFGAAGFVKRQKVWECSRLFVPELGKETATSSNVAEYAGFISILEYLIDAKMNAQPILILGDSNLVIQQMFGSWKITAGYYVP